MEKGGSGLGLLYVKIMDVFPTCDKKFSTSKLLVKVGDQGYVNICDISQGGIELNETRMFQCRNEDSLELQFSDDKNGYESELRFPLKKLIQMPRVKHVIEAILMKKVDKDKRNDPNLKVENMLQVNLEVIYLNHIQGKFNIETMEVELIRDTEMFGEMDPFIVIKLGSNTYTTKPKMNEGKHCIWTERIEMEVKNSGASKLLLKVFDKDTLRDDLVCSGEIMLLKEGLLIPSEKPKERQFSLFYDKKIAGTIKMQFYFEILPFNY